MAIVLVVAAVELVPAPDVSAVRLEEDKAFVALLGQIPADAQVRVQTAEPTRRVRLVTATWSVDARSCVGEP